MNIGLLPYLLCPNCAAERLQLTPFSVQDDDVSEGIITCAACNVWYRIENGILDFMPCALRNQDAHKRFVTKHQLPFSAHNPLGHEHDKQSQKEFYEDEENAEEFERLVVSSNYYRALNEVTFIPWMREHLGSGNMALDLGCGTGKQCLYLADHGVRTIGMDISERMLVWARTKIVRRGLGKRVDLVVGDAEHPPVKDGCFDACIYYGTLHHLEHKDVAIRSAARKLREGGRFYSLDPHKSPVRFMFDLLMRVWKIYDEKASSEALLSETALLRWLSDAGLMGSVRLTTYFPPHLWRACSLPFGIKLLRVSDGVLSRIPGVRTCAGVIIAEGVNSGAA